MASPDDKTVFNVRSFGAVGDGTNLDSPAINQAIQAASAAGGGTVFVPAGTYLCGSIRLTNNLHLYLDAGAIILGAPQAMNAYDATEALVGPGVSGRRAHVIFTTASSGARISPTSPSPARA